MFPKLLFTLFILFLPVISAPSPLPQVPEVADPIPSRYIIMLKDGVSLAAHINSVQNIFSSTPSRITQEFKTINGYAGEFTVDTLNELRANSDIDFIEADGTSYTSVIRTQHDAPWGLGRISSREKLSGSNDTALTFLYEYDSIAGAGATVYIIDTGIFITHPAFEGRASWGATFGGYEDQDGNGHGTHCAGTAVSRPYGVAKSALVVAVKVLGDDGSGRNSDVVSGIDWVAENASGKPAVASMSLGGYPSYSIDKAVRTLNATGVTVVVAVGNEDLDATTSSPARVKEAITVGASTFGDSRASFSNYGPLVDIFAPGVNITSTWNNGSTNVLSGTSMATPHVSGYAAYLLGLDSSLTPPTIASTISNGALSYALSDIPPGTPNKLLYNGL